MIAFNPVDCLSALEGVVPNRAQRILNTLVFVYYTFFCLRRCPVWSYVFFYARFKRIEGDYPSIISMLWIHRDCWATRHVRPEIVDFGSDQGRNEFETEGVECYIENFK